mgnify:FL=1
MLAVLRILLHKYSRQDDFAIGTLIANRNRTELENVIGFFTNTLAFRTDIDPQLSFMQRSLIRHSLWRVGRCGGPVG